jgi:hypothetical protein
VESDEARIARVAAERAASKPLYQQLAEQMDKKQQEYDENTKKIFAPPKVLVGLHLLESHMIIIMKALDEDDVEFFKELAENKSKAMSARAKREEEDLMKFREKVSSQHLLDERSSGNGKAVTVNPVKEHAQSQAQVNPQMKVTPLQQPPILKGAPVYHLYLA